MSVVESQHAQSRVYAPYRSAQMELLRKRWEQIRQFAEIEERSEEDAIQRNQHSPGM